MCFKSIFNDCDPEIMGLWSRVLGEVKAIGQIDVGKV